MKIAVLIKQVPSSEAKIRVGGDGRSIDTDGVEYVVNPYDEFAMEAALQAKEKFGGEVVVFGLGGDKVEESLRQCLALGADQAVVLRDGAFDGSDSLGVARILAAAVKGVEPNLVFCGKVGIDRDDAAVGVMVAELLGMPHVSVVTELEWTDESHCKVGREIEGGSETLEVTLPAVLTANKGLNEPRYASLKGIMMAKKKPMEVKDAAALGIDAGTVGSGAALTSVVKMEPPAERSAGKMIQGDAAQMVQELVRVLKDEAKVL
ncbi:MAG: electron transfer flavoprotein subunit beta/FixA family protein [Candidatus Eisenbacteria bacterium]